MIRVILCFALYLLDVSLVRGGCLEDTALQLKAMHEGASEVAITWLGEKPKEDDVFLSIEGACVSLKPHIFKLVCADGKEYQGKAEPCLRVPVLLADVGRGDLIQKIDYQNVPCRLVNKKVIETADNLIGMQAKVFIKAGQPILDGQIEKPKLIKKGDNITIQYQTPFFVITSQGVAQRDGSLGDIVGVTSQKKVLSARVVSHNLVQVDHL